MQTSMRDGQHRAEFLRTRIRRFAGWKRNIPQADIAVCDPNDVCLRLLRRAIASPRPLTTFVSAFHHRWPIKSLRPRIKAMGLVHEIRPPPCPQSGNMANVLAAVP